MASNDAILVVGAAAVAVVAYMGNVGGFRTWADSLSGGGIGVPQPQGNCSTLKCPSGYTKKKMPGFTDCQCSPVGQTTTQLNPNCKYLNDPKTGQTYTIWKSSGCSGGYLRNGLEASIIGHSCNAARAAFLRAYPCPRAALAHAFAYEGFDNVTVS